jgi:hypothetical protein
MSQPNTIEYKSRTWLVMQCLKDFGPQERSFLIGSPDDKQAANSIVTLLRTGYIKRIENDLLDITRAGAHKLRQINEAVSPSGDAAGKRTHTNGVMTDAYQAPELRRTCQRPGAYDAFELPSLMGGQLHYRREIQA